MIWRHVLRSIPGDRGPWDDAEALDCTTAEGRASRDAIVAYVKEHRAMLGTEGMRADMYHMRRSDLYYEAIARRHGNVGIDLLMSCLKEGGAHGTGFYQDVSRERLIEYRSRGDLFPKSVIRIDEETDDGPEIIRAVSEYLKARPEPTSTECEEHIKSLGLSDPKKHHVAAALKASGREPKLISVGEGKRERRWVQVEPCAAE